MTIETEKQVPKELGPATAYEDLPRHRGEPVAWSVFGEGDDIGTMNLVHREQVIRAAQIVRSGRTFPLDRGPLAITPGLFGRDNPRHHVFTSGGGRSFDDVLDNVYPQGAAQWDSLAHIQAFPGEYYGGTTAEDVLAGRCTIDHLARRAVAGRAVVLDVESLLTARDGDYDPGRRSEVTVADLDRALDSTGLQIEPGDVVIVHTGWSRWYAGLDADQRAEVAKPPVTAVGLEAGPEMASRIWAWQPSAMVSDCPALEAWPPNGGSHDFLHATVIGRLGIHIGELWWTSDLVDDCRADGRFEALLVAAPWLVPGGVGSPANAVALK